MQLQTHERRDQHTSLMTGAGLLSAAAAVAVLVAAGSWFSACQDGTFDRCLNGRPSFELVFQAVLAAAGLGMTLLMRHFVKRRSYARAGAALAAGVVLFMAWALFLDAATHGWDDLKLLWLG